MAHDKIRTKNTKDVMSNNFDVSIVIVSYNVKDLLVKCLESIYRFRNNSIKTEIIIVDNHSSDGTIHSIKELFPEVMMIDNKRNTGFSFANNQGIEASTGEYIFLLNPDTEMNADVIDVLLSECRSEKNQIISPGLRNSDGTLQVSCYKFPGLFSVIAEAFFLHGVFSVYKYPPDYFNRKFFPDWASGAALFFHMDVYKKIGKLDENLFWMDDVDFCYRAFLKNIKTVYLPGKWVVHHSGKSSEKNLPVTISNQLISKAKYLLKHNGMVVSTIALFFILFQIVSRIILFSLLSPFKKIYWYKLNAYLITLGRFFNFIFKSDQSIS